MTLEELLYVTNLSTNVDIVDADTGEVYGSGTPDDLEDAKFAGEKIYDFSVEDLMDCEVMDINVYGNRLTICIEVDSSWLDDEVEDLFNDPDTVDGWIQQDLIDSYRRER